MTAREEKPDVGEQSEDLSFVPLPLDSRTWLLGWARRSVAADLGGTALPAPELLPEGVEVVRSCFVSLHRRDGGLQGCIGSFEAVRPLWHNVREMAIAAATRDPRFVPLKAAGLADCVVEISALTPLQAASPESIEVGTHGIWVSKGWKRGVLLPQVATEYSWDRETFLDHTCIKAGLPPSAWRDGSVEIRSFRAEVFSEPH